MEEKYKQSFDEIRHKVDEVIKLLGEVLCIVNFLITSLKKENS